MASRPAQQEMRMKLLMVFVMLMCCSFFHAAESDSGYNCDEHLTIVSVPAGEDVLIPCPNVTSDVMTFELLRNGETVFTENFLRESQGGHIETRVVDVNGTFNLQISRVNGSSHGVYKCEVEVIYPPPTARQSSSQRILLLVEEHQYKDRVVEGERVNCLLIWIPTVATVSLYGLIVTVILVMSCVRLRTMDSDSEYMNTKPPTPRAHWWKA